MKRREFLTSAFLMTAVAGVLGKAAGVIGNVAQAAVVWVTAGKLGYKEVSPNPAKHCSTCKHFQADAATPGGGKCILPAMASAMKAKDVHVKEAAYCNMWAKKA